jgi:ElaA protein
MENKAFEHLVDELYDLLRVRSEVFVVEQNCVYLDGKDKLALHLCRSLKEVVAHARLIKPESSLITFDRKSGCRR